MKKKYRLIDVDGKEITPTELAEKYFGSPEVCFIKADAIAAYKLPNHKKR